MLVLKAGAISAMVLAVMIAIAGQEGTNPSRGQSTVPNDADVPKFKLDIMRKQAAETGVGEGEDSYKAGENITFHIMITNISNENLAVPILDNYYQNRLELMKGGRLVPYRKGIVKVLDKRDNNLEFSRRDYLNLQPGETREIEPIALSDWYDPLESGVYQLTIKHRFFGGGPWVASPPMTFEVVP